MWDLQKPLFNSVTLLIFKQLQSAYKLTNTRVMHHFVYLFELFPAFPSFFFFTRGFPDWSNTSIAAPTRRLSGSCVPRGGIFAGFIEWEDRMDAGRGSIWICHLTLDFFSLKENCQIRNYMCRYLFWFVPQLQETFGSCFCFEQTSVWARDSATWCHKIVNLEWNDESKEAVFAKN